jgi:hypothetical protein
LDVVPHRAHRQGREAAEVVEGVGGGVHAFILH